jgi:hypothetical protein
MLAAGSYSGVRRAERLVSGAGLARERIPDRAKAAAWWTLPAAARAAEVTAVVGRRLLLATTAGAILIDMRRVAGWALAPDPAGAAGQPGGLTTVRRQKETRDAPSTLF